MNVLYAFTRCFTEDLHKKKKNEEDNNKEMEL